MMSFELRFFKGSKTFNAAQLLAMCLFLLSFPKVHAQIVINEIFPGGTVELKNIGENTIDLSDYWLCEFPDYQRIGDSNLACEGSSTSLEPGAIIAVDDFNVIDADDGEVGLYSTNSFGDPSALVHYVQWGSGRHRRASVAVQAGILQSTDQFVPAFGPMESLAYDGAGNSPLDWQVLMIPTICEENAVCDVDGGELSGGPFQFCVGDGIDDFVSGIILVGNEGPNTQWIVTNEEGIILGLPPSPEAVNFDGAGTGVCFIWHLSFEEGIQGLEVGLNANDLAGCSDLSNPITVERIGVNGGELTTADGLTELEICAGDGNSDAFDVTLTGAAGPNSAWVITDDQLNILALPDPPPFDLEGAGPGICLIWHLSFADGLTGAEVGANAGELEGCFDLSNPITVKRIGVNGGELTTADGLTELEICAGDGNSDAFDVTLTGAAGPNSAWVITDDQLNILALPDPPPFDLEGAGPGICLIWHLSFADGLTGAEVGANAGELEGCFDLSNPITVKRIGVNGGELTTADGLTELEICAGDGNSDAFDVTLTGAAGPNSAWVITDDQLNILALPDPPPFDLEGAGPGICLIWHLSFADGLTGAEVGANAGELEGCFDLSNPITVKRKTGEDCDDILEEGPDVELTISAPEEYQIFETFTYTLVLTNNGTESASNIQVDAAIPEGTAFAGSSATKGDYGPFFQRWEVEVLESGESASLEINVYPLIEGTTITNFVQVIAMDEEDVDSSPDNGIAPNPVEDDEAVAIVQSAVIPPMGGIAADLELNISTEEENYQIYQDFTYVVELTNNGPDDASNIVVSLPFPEGMVYSNSETELGRYGFIFQQWEIPSLGVGQTTILRLTLFPLVEDTELVFYGQVSQVDQEDPDSTPNNGEAPMVVEDDEAVTSNSSMGSGFVHSPFDLGKNQSSTITNVYPNPASIAIQVETKSTTSHRTLVNIVDNQGRIIEQMRQQLTKGFNQFSIDVSRLNSGKYFLVFDEKRVPFMVTR